MIDFSFKVLLLLSVLVLAAGNWRGDSVFGNYFSLLKSRNNLVLAVEKLSEETELLEQEIHKIRASPSYAEKIFKDKYHVTGEHESIIFFAD
ncbi:MAG: hypothetical protein KA436_09065 [Oligoflexales bacterium]|nr:hypothetical protein [Oligoflexales bacterium]